MMRPVKRPRRDGTCHHPDVGFGRAAGRRSRARRQAVGDLAKLGRPAFPLLARLAERAATRDERLHLATALGQAVNEELPRLVRAGDLAAAERLLEIGLVADIEAGPVLDNYVA